MAAWTDGLLGQRRESEALGRAFRGIFKGGEQTEGERRKARLATALERRRRLFADARAVLSNAGRTAFVLVLIPERLPLEETSRAVDALAASGIEVTGLIVNQVLPEIDDGGIFRRAPKSPAGVAGAHRRALQRPAAHRAAVAGRRSLSLGRAAGAGRQAGRLLTLVFVRAEMSGQASLSWTQGMVRLE